MKNLVFQIGLLLSTLVVFSSCEDNIIDPIVNSNPGEPQPYNLEIGYFTIPSLPDDNALTVQGVKLGRMLFYETMLSGNQTQSCASCHRQENAFSDTARLSTGIDGLHGKRNAMSIFNLAWNSNDFFWDGRAHLLRDQALQPIQDMLEMNETLDHVVSKLSGDGRYRESFKAAFGTEEINSEYISKALEQFMIAIVSNQSRYDAWLNGEASLSASEERGRALFFTGVNPFYPSLSGPDCAHCHGGSNFRNDKYINNGLEEESFITDIGRQAVTQQIDDRGKFKVPSLRNVALTPPYMHDGRFQTLEEVIDHYDHNIQPSSTLDPVLEERRETGLQLSAQDKKDLIAFLMTLSDYNLTSNPAYSDPF